MAQRGLQNAPTAKDCKGVDIGSCRRRRRRRLRRRRRRRRRRCGSLGGLWVRFGAISEDSV